jgi:hypothetical protein
MTLNVPFRVMVVGDGRKGGVLILSNLASDMSREFSLQSVTFRGSTFPSTDQSRIDKQLLVYVDDAMQ